MLPVTEPDILGVREAVDDSETGCLCPPGRTEQLVQAIAELTDGEKQTQYGRAGRRRVEERFNVQTMADACVRLYERLHAPDGNQ